MFHVGQLVVCVDDSPGRLSGERHFTRGNIYTISATAPATRRHPAGVRVEESPSPSVTSWVDAARFRPVDEARLTVFRKLLAPVPSKERELS